MAVVTVGDGNAGLIVSPASISEKNNVLMAATFIIKPLMYRSGQNQVLIRSISNLKIIIPGVRLSFHPTDCRSGFTDCRLWFT